MKSFGRIGALAVLVAAACNNNNGRLTGTAAVSGTVTPASRSPCRVRWPPAGRLRHRHRFAYRLRHRAVIVGDGNTLMAGIFASGTVKTLDTSWSKQVQMASGPRVAYQTMDGTVKVTDLAGNKSTFVTGFTGSFLVAPDAAHVLLTDGHLVSTVSAGGNPVPYLHGTAIGWLDAGHFVAQSANATEPYGFQYGLYLAPVQ